MNIYKLNIIMIFILFHAVFGQAPELENGWPYEDHTGYQPTGATPYFSMTNDLEKSAIFFNTNLGDADKFHFNAAFFSGWPNDIDSLVFMLSPVLADLDHDGMEEMLNFGRTDGTWHNCYLFAFDNDGSVMSGFPIPLHLPEILNVADIDGDNEYEIISDSWDDRLIYCFDRFGIPKTGWPITMPEDFYLRHYTFAASVGDLDADGRNEIVMDGDKHIYAYRLDGSPVAGFPISIFDSTYNYSHPFYTGCLADFDNDGYLEYAVSGSNLYTHIYDPQCFVALYDHMGLMKEGWPIFRDGTIKGGLTIADMNHDGYSELGYLSGGYISNGLCFVDGHGQPLPGWPIFPKDPNSDSMDISSGGDLIIADVNNDGAPEIFKDYSTLYGDSSMYDSLGHYGYSYLVGYDQSGHFLPGLPTIVNGWYSRRPPNFAYDPQSQKLFMGLATDIDIAPYLMIDTLYLEIYRWPNSASPLTEWPMVNHDNLHTRNYNFIDRVTSIYDGNREILPKSYILKQNYPNPFNGNTIIEFVLPKEEYINISIYDILGRKVRDVIGGKLGAGTHKETINMGNASSGVYFYVLQGEKSRITRKMMLIK